MMIHLFEILASLTESALGIAVPAKLLGEKRSGGIRLAAAAAVLTAVVWGINQYAVSYTHLDVYKRQVPGPLPGDHKDWRASGGAF